MWLHIYISLVFQLFKPESWSSLVFMNLELSYIHISKLKSTRILMLSRWYDRANLCLSVFNALQSDCRSEPNTVHIYSAIDIAINSFVETNEN